MIDSLAEQVSSDVSTYTRPRSSVGSELVVLANTVVDANGSGSSALPVTGLVVGCLLLNCVRSKTLPLVRAEPAIM